MSKQDDKNVKLKFLEKLSKYSPEKGYSRRERLKMLKIAREVLETSPHQTRECRIER